MESLNKNAALQNVSLTKRIVITIMCIVTFFLLRVPEQIAPQFAETFAAFGTELPSLTLLMMALVPIYVPASYITALPLLIWFTFLFSPNQQALLFKSGLIINLSAFAIFILFIAALYLPILQLGAVV